MTTDEFNKKLDAKLQAIIKEDKPLFLGVKSIMSVQSKRIWIDGKNKSGSNIGTYKGGQIYINPNGTKKTPAPPKQFEPKGKSGKTTFKNGNKHKTGYFSNYLAFKKNQGRNKTKSSVDLFLHGDLASDWANAPITDSPPKNGTAIKVNAHNYIVSLSGDNLDKVERYGVNEVFGLSIKEKGIFLNVVRTELARSLR